VVLGQGNIPEAVAGCTSLFRFHPVSPLVHEFVERSMLVVERNSFGRRKLKEFDIE
jgi:hypothetical protein